MSQTATTIAKQNAKVLRKQLTEAEQHLWRYLRRQQLGVKFRRQTAIDKYIVDFFCHECRLVIELDGGQHAENVCYDNQRSRDLQQRGLAVLRFWNNQVLMETEAVLAQIVAMIEQRKG